MRVISLGGMKLLPIFIISMQPIPLFDRKSCSAHSYHFADIGRQSFVTFARRKLSNPANRDFFMLL